MRLVLALSLACSWVWIGCGSPQKLGDDLGDPGLGDAHFSTECLAQVDCDDLDGCTDDLCQSDHTCKHTAKDCSPLDDECNAGNIYWIVIDGRNGAVSPYQLTVQAPGCP